MQALGGLSLQFVRQEFEVVATPSRSCGFGRTAQGDQAGQGVLDGYLLTLSIQEKVNVSVPTFLQKLHCRFVAI